MDRERQGQMGQFVAAARQRLDGLDSGHAIKNLPGASMRFVKNNGQEQVVVTLKPPAAAEQPQRPREEPQPNLPEFCVVDLVVPTSSVDQEFWFAYEARQPETYRGEEFAFTPEHDFPTDEPGYSEFYGADVALMRASRHDLGGSPTLSIARRVSSLKLDLRDMPADEPVVIDVYGAAVSEGPRITKPYEFPRTVLEQVVGVAYLDEGGADFYWLDGTGSPHDGTNLDPQGNTTLLSNVEPAVFRRSVPNLLFAELFDRWLLDADYDTTEFNPLTLFYEQERLDPDTGLPLERRRFVITAQAAATSLTADLAPNGVPSQRTTWTLSAEQVTQEYDVSEVTAHTADIVHAFYWGDPGLVASETLHEDRAGIWSIGGDEPQRVKIGAGDVPPSAAGDVGFADQSGFTLIGTLTIIRRGPVISWEQA